VSEHADIAEAIDAGIKEAPVGAERALLILALYEIRTLRSRSATQYRGHEMEALYSDAMKYRKEHAA
jgi:hypothetical protein